MLVLKGEFARGSSAKKRTSRWSSPGVSTVHNRIEGRALKPLIRSKRRTLPAATSTAETLPRSPFGAARIS